MPRTGRQRYRSKGQSRVRHDPRRSSVSRPTTRPGWGMHGTRRSVPGAASRSYLSCLISTPPRMASASTRSRGASSGSERSLSEIADASEDRRPSDGDSPVTRDDQVHAPHDRGGVDLRPVCRERGVAHIQLHASHDRREDRPTEGVRLRRELGAAQEGGRADQVLIVSLAEDEVVPTSAVADQDRQPERDQRGRPDHVPGRGVEHVVRDEEEEHPDGDEQHRSEERDRSLGEGHQPERDDPDRPPIADHLPGVEDVGAVEQEQDAYRDQGRAHDHPIPSHRGSVSAGIDPVKSVASWL